MHTPRVSLARHLQSNGGGSKQRGVHGCSGTVLWSCVPCLHYTQRNLTTHFDLNSILCFRSPICTHVVLLIAPPSLPSSCPPYNPSFRSPARPPSLIVLFAIFSCSRTYAFELRPSSPRQAGRRKGSRTMAAACSSLLAVTGRQLCTNRMMRLPVTGHQQRPLFLSRSPSSIFARLEVREAMVDEKKIEIFELIKSI